MNNRNDFTPWELKWETTHIIRFWDWLGTRPRSREMYFSKRVGDSILDVTSRYIPLKGTVLDFGAGPGFFINKLISRGCKPIALDTYSESIAILTKNNKDHKNFIGGLVSQPESIPLGDSFADIVFMIETIEHLDDVILLSVLYQAHRIIKPGGFLIITTPNEENLSENHILCPNCGCVFHTVQHLRNWFVDSIRDLFYKFDFKEITCHPTIFSWHSKALRPFHSLKYMFTNRKYPHLIYIGQKL